MAKISNANNKLSSLKNKNKINKSSKKTFKILSIDGGGVRGIIPAMILAKIEKDRGKRISELFDLIAGTSAGGIIALGLSIPNNKNEPKYKAVDLVNLYRDKSKYIFPRWYFYNVFSLGGIIEEKYKSRSIEKILKDYFGDARLSDSLTKIIITSYDLERRIAFFFKSDNTKNKKDYDFAMWKIARSTSAAPIYFDPFKLDDVDDRTYYPLIDGGMVANNPAMCALADAYQILREKKKEYHQRPFLLSLGTGITFKDYKYTHVKRWGLPCWAKPLINIFFDGVSQSVNYQLQQILQNHYIRLQPELQSENDNLDNADPSNIHDLYIRADNYIRKNNRIFDDIYKYIK